MLRTTSCHSRSVMIGPTMNSTMRLDKKHTDSVDCTRRVENMCMGAECTKFCKIEHTTLLKKEQCRSDHRHKGGDEFAQQKDAERSS